MIEKYRKYLQIEVRFGKPSYGGSMTLARQYGGSQWNEICVVMVLYRSVL
jgi:hypothetical protein